MWRISERDILYERKREREKKRERESEERVLTKG